MTLLHKGIAAAFAAVFLSPDAADAQTVAALLPASGNNVHTDILGSANEILKDHLQRTGKYTILALGGAPTTAEPTAAQASATARDQKAEIAVALRVTRLGNVARVRLAAYQAADGKVIHWDSMTTAGGPDDLDPVLARLALGLATGKPSSETADIETVTDKEQTALGRRTANKSFGVRVGSLFAFNSAGGKDLATVPGLGIFWLYDARAWLADVGVDLGRGGDNTSFTVGVGAYYPFTRVDFAPYVGGAVKWAVMDIGGRGASGLSINPSAGILLGRLSTVQIRGEIGYFVNTFSETSEDRLDEKYAHGPSLSVGISY